MLKLRKPGAMLLLTLLIMVGATPLGFAQEMGTMDPEGQATEAFMAGRTLEDEGDLSDAYEQYRKAYELDAGHYRAVYRAGRLLREMGKRQNAHAALRRAIAIAPNFYPAYNHLGLLLVEDGNLAGAIDAYRGGTEAAPDLAQAWRNLARALADAGQVDEAIGTYERALAIEPDHEVSRLALATLYEGKGNTEAAVQLREGLEWERSFVAVPADASTGQEMADGGMAEEPTIESIMPDPAETPSYAYPPLGVENTTHLRQQGIDHVRSGQYAAGIAALSAALRYGGPDPETWSELGFARYETGSYPEAAMAWNRAAELSGPEAAGHRLNEALALRAAGDFAGARKALRRALDLQPAFAHAHYLLGLLALEEHDLTAGIRHFRAAVQADPAHISAYQALATTLEGRDQLDEAVRVCRLTLRLHPGDPETLQTLARVLERQHLLPEALDAYEALLVVTTGDPVRANLHELAEVKVAELAHAATQLAPLLADQAAQQQPVWMDDLSDLPPGPPFVIPDMQPVRYTR